MISNYLLTGSTGFIGRYIQDALKVNGKCHTLGRGSKLDITCDLSKQVPDFSNFSFDIIIHNAGKAHMVPKTPTEKTNFFEINHHGTLNLLKGIDRMNSLPKLFVFISSVAVYGRETGIDIDELQPTLGVSPYALSKIRAEQSILEWGAKNHISIVILRLPLVIGFDGPPGNFKSLLDGIRSGYYFRPGSGKAKKSMMWAADLGALIASLSEKNAGIYNLTDGEDPRLSDLDKALADKLGKSIKEIPEGLLKWMSKLGDKVPFFPFGSYQFEKLTLDLTFSCAKAVKELDWKPTPVVRKIKEFEGKIS